MAERFRRYAWWRWWSGTHAVVDAELDGCGVGEVTLAARVVRLAGPGMLVLADREFLGVPLWRVPANRVLDVEQALPDGSWRSRLYAAGDRPARRSPVRGPGGRRCP
jgi:hypothetical protein